MVALTSLWLPILLSAVIVFVASSVIHMALPWHKNDFKRFGAEDDVLDALRKFDLTPGDYAGPMPENMAEMNSDEYKAKIARGPQVLLTVMKPGSSMARQLVSWFVFLIIVSAFPACIAGSALAPGTDYMIVFRMATYVAFACYSVAIWMGWIWYSRSLGYTIRTTIDGFVYALLTGGVFGWLWP